MKILLVVGTRPNFVKAAPIIREIEKYNDIEYLLVHTGQHYDDNMSKMFFNDLMLPMPNVNLNVSHDTQNKQIAEIMVSFDTVCDKYKPDVVVIIGDVNSSLACAITASKINNIKIAHVEAGPRVVSQSTTSEEKNRRIIDTISDYLFAPNMDAVNNLKRENMNGEIYLTGDVAIDSLLYVAKNIDNIKQSKPYVMLTLHRPFNVDDPITLKSILIGVNAIAHDIKVIFPIHPRTKNNIEKFGFTKYIKNINVVEPLGYIEFVSMMKNAKMVITDSGGIQTETTILGIPCITLMDESGQNHTLNDGTNILAGSDTTKIYNSACDILCGKQFKEFKHYLYDGKVAERMIKILRSDFNG